MLNSAEHEILNAHKYKNVKKINILGSGKPRMLIFPAYKCSNVNSCWHFNINEQEKFHAHLGWAGKIL